jgi:acyl-CoA synthetase (AMP-forming)/AMP-acid ligase II
MTQPHFRTIAEVLRYRAEAQADCPAYTFLRDGEIEDRTFTYAELDRASRSLATMLREWRIQRPLLVYAPGLEFITAFFACAYAGITPVPAGLPHVTRIGRSLTRLSSIAADADADAVLSTMRVIERATGDPEFMNRAPELARMRWLATDCLHSEIPGSVRPSELQDEMPAFIQYTSGSTSVPKGVVVTHRSLLHNLAYCNAVEENDNDTISVSWLPHSHDMGLIEAILLPAFGGYRAYLMSPASFLRRPARWLEAITRFRATNSGGPNFAFDLCVDKVSSEEQETLDLSSWRVAYNGSETIRKETLVRFGDIFQGRGFLWLAFYRVYGLAESTLLVSSGSPSDAPVFREIDAAALGQGSVKTACADTIKAISVVASGRASFDTRVVITHPETAAECEHGQVGEIWVASPSVAAGYWRRPGESERTFKAYLAGRNDGPFLRTGDLGFLSEGHLFVTGRIKDTINIRGFKHYPQDIEHTVAQSHSAVCPNGCAAFGVACDGSEQLVLVVEIRPKLFQSSADLADQAITAIHNSVTEHHGVAIHALALASYGTIPKTTSGKLQRQACRRSFMEGTLPVMRVWSRDPHFSQVGSV